MMYAAVSIFTDSENTNVSQDDVHTIYFGGANIFDTFMDWFNQRVPLTQVDSPSQFASYFADVQGGSFFVSTLSISCRNYQNEKEVYIVEFERTGTKDKIASDVYPSLDTAMSIATPVNIYSDAIHATVYRAMVIVDEEDLDVLKKYLTSCDNMAKQLGNFHSVEEIA